MGASSRSKNLSGEIFEKNNTDDEHILNLGLCGKGLIEAIRMNEKWENILDRKRLSHGAGWGSPGTPHQLPARPPAQLTSFLPSLRRNGAQGGTPESRWGPSDCPPHVLPAVGYGRSRIPVLVRVPNTRNTIQRQPEHNHNTTGTRGLASHSFLFRSSASSFCLFGLALDLHSIG